ncbi:initiation factor 2 [Xylaria cf. heliscus]|nr:initiation factor 2 [Xylaria cf. heliscus]
MTGPGAFWRSAPKIDNLRSPSLLKTAEDSRITTEPPATRPEESASRANNAVAPLGGFDALEAAGARDAEAKDGTKNLLRGNGISQEWGKLMRKPTGKPNLENDFWSAMQSNVSKSQPKSFGNEGVDPSSPVPQVVAKSTPIVDDSISRSLPPDPQVVAKSTPITDTSTSRSSPPDSWSRKDGYNHESNRQRDFSEREGRLGKKRSGKRSQRVSRFEEEDDEDEYDRLQEKRRQKEMRKAQREADRTEPIPIILPELISITAFANALQIKPDDFLVQLGELGFEGVTVDSLMAGETAALVAQEYGYEPTVDLGGSQDLKPRPPPEDPSSLPLRPPVVTIMGHVDHGKTTILDYLRESSVAAQEHGGITQHIGAFSIKLSSGKPITFLDTPGHAAFLTMRQRGANVTDIVVLVVAADDGVKPQTVEALKHARAAKVPIIVAINKIDKDGAHIDNVKADLAAAGIEIEDFGGDVQVVCVSGKTGQGMEDLEENILALSEILDLRSEIDGPAEGWVLESSLKSTGKVATILVKRGTLRPGDYIAAGITWAKIRQLRNEAGVDMDEAPPGTPVEVLGWKDLPAAGDQVIQSPDEDGAKSAASYREGLREREKDAAEYEIIAEMRRALQEKRAREKAANEGATNHTGGSGVQDIPLDEENGTKKVNFVVKADVHGSVEAVCATIQEIGNHEVQPRVLRSGAGAITEFDVEHAATSKSVLVSFGMITPGHIRRLAENQGVRILEHTIIYSLIDDVKANLSEYLTPTTSTRVLGEAEVLQIFPINLRGRVYKNIAGCRVRTGVVGKNNLYRIIRKGEVIYDGKLETLKNVKKDVMEMGKNTECGMGFEDFQDFEVGDSIHAYEEVHTARSF